MTVAAAFVAAAGLLVVAFAEPGSATVVGGAVSVCGWLLLAVLEEIAHRR